MLLVGRGLQGCGCAGLNILTKVILADKVSLAENARNNTSFTVVAGISYGIGPVIGGYLTKVSWRWCFGINIPILLLGALAVHFILRPELLGPQEITCSDSQPHQSPLSYRERETFITRLSTLDFAGQFLFLFGTGLLVLALTWGGSTYSWNDPQVFVPLAVSIVLLFAFLLWECTMIPGSSMANRFPYKRAMIPLKLLWTRNVGILIYINLITGMGMLQFVPISTLDVSERPQAWFLHLVLER
jgi:MFS family permease